MEKFCKVFGAVFVVLSMCSLVLSQNCLMRGGCYKHNERTHSQVDFFLCGDDIYRTFMDVCRATRRRKRAVKILIDRQASSKFLVRRKRRTYDIVEECCNEGCRVEEVHEYCHIML